MYQQKYVAELVPRMRALPQPVIAAVNGPAAGAGYALALGADLRVASTSAVFVDAFVKIGASGAEMGLSWLLQRIVGATRAAELVLTGRRVDADEAARIGLVLDTVPDGEVVDAALALAEQIIVNTPLGTWMGKATLWSNLEIPSLEAAIDLEARTQILTLGTETPGNSSTPTRNDGWRATRTTDAPVVRSRRCRFGKYTRAAATWLARTRTGRRRQGSLVGSASPSGRPGRSRGAVDAGRAVAGAFEKLGEHEKVAECGEQRVVGAMAALVCVAIVAVPVSLALTSTGSGNPPGVKLGTSGANGIRSSRP